MVKKKQTAINTTKNGKCRTIVCWYHKGGRTNFADWKGNGKFAMTAVLEEYELDDDDTKNINNL